MDFRPSKLVRFTNMTSAKGLKENVVRGKSGKTLVHASFQTAMFKFYTILETLVPGGISWLYAQKNHMRIVTLTSSHVRSTLTENARALGTTLAHIPWIDENSCKEIAPYPRFLFSVFFPPLSYLPFLLFTLYFIILIFFYYLE